MSVINQMLKDLDERQTEQHGAPVIAPQPVKSNNAVVILLGLLLIVILAFAAWYVWHNTQTPAVSSVNEIKTVEQPQVIEPETIESKTSEPKAVKKSIDAVTVKESVASNLAESNPVISNTVKESVEPKLTNNVNQNEQKVAITKSIKAAVAQKVNTQQATAPLKNTEPEISVAKKSVVKKQAEQLAKPLLKPQPKPESKLVISRKKLTPQELAQQKLQKAEKAMADNRLVEAENLFADVLILQPQHQDARKQLAALLYGKKSYQAALNVLQQGLVLLPENSDFRLMKARVYLAANQPQLALNTLTEQSQLLNHDYQLLLANTAQQLNQNDIASEAYTKLVGLVPNNSRYWLGLAIANDRQGLFEQAKQAYRSALQFTGLSQSAQAFAQQRLAELGE